MGHNSVRSAPADADHGSRRSTTYPRSLILGLAAHVHSNRHRDLRPLDLLRGVSRLQRELFSGWTPVQVSNTLLRYGIRTVKSNGRRVYRGVSAADLGRIQQVYDVALDSCWVDPADPADPGNGGNGRDGHGAGGHSP